MVESCNRRESGEGRRPCWRWSTLGKLILTVRRPEGELQELRKHGRTARPLGDEAFLDCLKGLVERVLKPKKAGRPKKTENQ